LQFKEKHTGTFEQNNFRSNTHPSKGVAWVSKELKNTWQISTWTISAN
jgi:hypothetical protein